MSISKLAVNDANKAMIGTTCVSAKTARTQLKIGVLGQLGGVPLLYKAMIWDPPAGDLSLAMHIVNCVSRN